MQQFYLLLNISVTILDPLRDIMELKKRLLRFKLTLDGSVPEKRAEVEVKLDSIEEQIASLISRSIQVTGNSKAAVDGFTFPLSSQKEIEDLEVMVSHDRETREQYVS